MPEILIEVLNKNLDRPDTFFLDKLASNYTGVYSVQVETIFQDEKEKRRILFTDIAQLERRIKGTVDLFNLFLRFMIQDEEPNRFNYIQRVMESRDKRQTPKDSTNFLLALYTTDLTPIFDEYFNFLNQLFPVLGILCYIEKVEDKGYELYFERESDLCDFLFNTTDKESILRFFRDKHLDVPNQILEQMVEIVVERLTLNNHHA
jgi:hypothetical protein